MMKLAFGRAAVFVIVCAASNASAQIPAPASQPTIGGTLDSWISNAEQHVVPAADALPEDEYGFAPQPPSACSAMFAPSLNR